MNMYLGLCMRFPGPLKPPPRFPCLASKPPSCCCWYCWYRGHLVFGGIMIILFIAVLYWLVVVIPKGHFHDNFMMMIISTQIWYWQIIFEVCFYLWSWRVEVSRSARALQVPSRRTQVVLVDYYHLDDHDDMVTTMMMLMMLMKMIMMMKMTTHLWGTNGPGSRMLRQGRQLGTLIIIIRLVIVVMVIVKLQPLWQYESRISPDTSLDTGSSARPSISSSSRATRSEQGSWWWRQSCVKIDLDNDSDIFYWCLSWEWTQPQVKTMCKRSSKITTTTSMSTTWYTSMQEKMETRMPTTERPNMARRQE